MNESIANQNRAQIQVAKTIFRRYRRMAIITTIIVMAAVVAYSVLMDPVYKATASVLIENKASSILTEVERNIDYNRDLALAQKALALSRPVLERAAETAKISQWDLPDYDIDPLSPYNEHVANAKIEGQLLILEVLNTDKDRAVLLANAWMGAFVDEMGRRNRSAAAYASQFLDNRMPAMKKDWTEKQTAVQNFLIETGFDRKEAEFHPVYKQYVDLNTQITQSRIHLATLRSEAAAWAASESRPDVLLQLPRAQSDLNIQAYEKLIQDKTKETIELRQNFDPNGDKVKRAETALAEMQTLNRKELQSVGGQLALQIQIEEKALTEMETLFQNFKAEYLKVKSHEARYQTLAFEAQLAQNQYEELMKRQRETSVEGNANYSYAQPWERADTPRKKYRPSWPLNIALGIFLSGFLSVSIAGIKELLNERIRTATELKTVGHTVAVEIPRMTRSQARDAFSIVRAHPNAAPAHALRMLRSSLASSHLWNTPKKSLVIMVTSAGRGEGKSFVASNLAMIFARSAAMNSGRVLLIDTDLNEPTLTYEMNRAGQAGLGALADEALPLDELVRRTGTENLDFVAAGPQVKNSGALIESQAFAQLLHEARQQYSIIIIDTPPLFRGSVLTEKCDAVVAVVRSKQTRFADLERLSAALSKARSVSYVLNSVSAVDFESVPAPVAPSQPKTAAVNDPLLETMTLSHG